MGFQQYEIFPRVLDKLVLSSFLPLVCFLLQVIGVAHTSKMILLACVFILKILDLIFMSCGHSSKEQRFSEDKTAAYIIVFSLGAFSCIIYDSQISPAGSELPCTCVTVDPSMIRRATRRGLKLEQICKTSFEYFALAVGFLSVVFSDDMGETLKNKTKGRYSSVYVYTDFVLEVSSFYCFIALTY